MSQKVGERINNCLNGKKYGVKSILQRTAVLEAEDKLASLGFMSGVNEI